MKHDFNDPAVFEQLEEKAIDGQLDYQDFPPEEYKYFSKLARLGYMNRHKNWDASLCEQLQEEYRERYYKDCSLREERYEQAKKQLADKLRVSELRTCLNRSTDPKRALLCSLLILETLLGENNMTLRLSRHLGIEDDFNKFMKFIKEIKK